MEKKAWLSSHAEGRRKIRTALSTADLLEILDDALLHALLWTEEVKTKKRRRLNPRKRTIVLKLFFSWRDNIWLVGVQDVLNGEVITLRFAWSLREKKYPTPASLLEAFARTRLQIPENKSRP